MPLDRSWYNSLIDDDGSGLTGTVWNKASVDSLMDVVDADKFTLGSAPFAPLAISGIVNDYNPGAAATGQIVWQLNPGSGTYLTGIVAPAVHGTQHLLINLGLAFVFSNVYVGSVTTNRIICPGYTDYTLQPWHSVWVYYSPWLLNWVVLKPS